MFMMSSLALHGEAGAWDEIALIAIGLLMLSVLAYVVWRSRGFEPELETPSDEDIAPRDGDGEANLK